LKQAKGIDRGFELWSIACREGNDVIAQSRSLGGRTRGKKEKKNARYRFLSTRFQRQKMTERMTVFEESDEAMEGD
jgi:hypothetical protein